MIKKYSLSVVLPAFNEEENIKEMIIHTDRALKNIDLVGYEIVVVDDGSKDQTGKILDNLVDEYNDLCVIHHEVNKGYADALSTGFENAKYSLVFYTDSDRQFDVNELKYLLDKIYDYDIVIGYRANRKDPVQRLFISHVYNTLINLIFKLDVKDVDCAFKLFKKSVLDNIQIKSKGFTVDLEILSKAKQKGYKITEVPVSHYKRPAGLSTVSWRAIFKTIRGIIWLKKEIQNAEKN